MGVWVYEWVSEWVRKKKGRGQCVRELVNDRVGDLVYIFSTKPFATMYSYHTLSRLISLRPLSYWSSSNVTNTIVRFRPATQDSVHFNEWWVCIAYYISNVFCATQGEFRGGLIVLGFLFEVGSLPWFTFSLLFSRRPLFCVLGFDILCYFTRRLGNHFPI